MPRTTFHEKLRHEGWALLPIRLIVGFGFAAHGHAKLSRGPEVFATILHSMGLPHPSVVVWITALLEFFGGICVMAGAFVVPLSLPLTAIMLTAMISVHLRYGFSSTGNRVRTDAQDGKFDCKDRASFSSRRRDV